jgi:hypothetical protein
MARMNKPLRLLFVACAGVGTFYVTAQWARGQHESQDGLAEAVTRAAPRAAVPKSSSEAIDLPTAPSLDSSLSASNRTRSIPNSKGDPFASLSWLPPPPPPPPAPAPAPPPKPAEPVTPPLPFTFVGMLERGAAKPEAFLAKGDVLLVVSVGDMLDNNTYRVDSMTSNEVVMTYLPMNIQQTLSVPGGTK